MLIQTKRSFVSLFLVVSSLFFVTGPAWAVTWATEWTQILNNIQLVEQKINQIKSLENEVTMIQHQVEGLKAVASYKGSMGDVSEILGRVNGVTNQSRAITQEVMDSYNATQSSVDALSKTFDVAGVNKVLVDQQSATADNAMRVVAQQNENLTQQQAAMQAVLAKSENAQGQTQAIQSLNLLIGSLSQQMSMLQQLMAQQIAMEREKMALEKGNLHASSTWASAPTTNSLSEPQTILTDEF